MPDVDVSFLSKTYLLPDELEQLVVYLQKFEDIRNNLMPLLIKQMNCKTWTEPNEAEFSYFKDPLSQTGKEIISDLAQKKIYDVTLDDLVYSNKGYLQLYHTCEDTAKEMLQILQRALQSFLNGYEKAYSSAASNIRGSGVSMWTSSVSSALVFSAMEASTLKRQADEADNQYKKAMTALDNNITNQEEREETQLLATKYYPNIADSINLFVSELMTRYIEKLENHGLFDYSKVAKYNIKRSSELLKNASIVSDKTSLLQEAFICCPYNPDVYQAVMEYGMSDIKTFETAKYFRQDSILTSSIEEYSKSNLANPDMIKIPVKILASYKNQSEESIWKHLLSEPYNNLLLYYGNLDSILNNRKKLITWIRGNITPDADVLCKQVPAELRNKVKRRLKSPIDDNQFSIMKEQHLLENVSAIIASSITLNEVNTIYANEIAQSIIRLIQELQPVVEKRKNLADMAKLHYEDSKKNYDLQIQSIQSKINEFEQKRSKLGFFAFSQKKQIDFEISTCKNEMSELLQANKPQEMYGEYTRLLKEVTSFDI